MRIRNDHGRFETRAIHAGQEPDPQNGAVMPPVYLTTTYEQEAPAVPRQGYEYSRTTNPTRLCLEENVASLEGGAWGLCFASGMAATNALLDKLVPGDHVVGGNDLYGGTYRIFKRVFERYGIGFTLVDAADPDAVRAAMCERTRFVFVETPSNPLLRLCDIATVAEIAHAGGALAIVDNTFATPYLQRPLELGADVVVHSMSKYLGGHSDVIAGALVGTDEALREELAFFQNSVGGCLEALSSFLVLRGTKTLAVRMDRHCANARALAEFLEAQPTVERVIYPGLASHPQHELAARQMTDFGGMLSFELAGGVEAADAFAVATRVFTLAESLGGVESLVEVPTSMTHAAIPAAERRAAGLADGLVRLSVGIEHVDDLIEDVREALDAAAARA
ncbi:MAG: cystathionine gamma-synthase [Planctomycetota bacterium]|jgi:cystathionine beta-lyase/cystathionine gamma-synthase|nr:cystathionine gamma-synthase [Planctomycetota bacterium]MDP6762188.1 cystathionine gamma-synthase [Planctomycetota bacterium]MDP6990076.1 cystathionine gamma-synthase [Planctomycetota bacterium]